MSQHSLATQAVLDSIKAIDFDWSNMEQAGSTVIAAAALRAVTDQVVPSDADEPRNYIPMAIECQRIRTELLAIAAELESA